MNLDPQATEFITAATLASETNPLFGAGTDSGRPGSSWRQVGKLAAKHAARPLRDLLGP